MCNLDEDQGFKCKNGGWNLVSIQTRDLIGISQKKPWGYLQDSEIFQGFLN
jgi:hypothetical protein